MSNRAIRRQQLKEPKAKSGSAPRAVPRTGPSGPSSGSAARRRGFGRIVPRFLAEIWSELLKVIWPSRRDVVYLTFVVIVVSIIIGAVLGAIDFGFGWLIDQTLLE